MYKYKDYFYNNTKNYLYKITTQRDYYFAFEVNDLDKLRKIEKIQITYE